LIKASSVVGSGRSCAKRAKNRSAFPRVIRRSWRATGRL
jgi:hypothetical protein